MSGFSLCYSTMIATIPNLKDTPGECPEKCWDWTKVPDWHESPTFASFPSGEPRENEIARTHNLPSWRDCQRYCEPKESPLFGVLEAICVAIFTVEYAGRLLTCHAVRTELMSNEVLLDMVVGDIPIVFQTRGTRFLNFIFAPPNLIDFFAIMPFYLELTLGTHVQGTTVLRVIRLTRLFRLFKAVKYFDVLQIMGRVLRKSMSALYVLLFYLFLCVCFSGSLIYYFESGEWDPKNHKWWRRDYARDNARIR